MAQICVPVLTLIMLCTMGLNCSEAASVRRGCCTMYSSGLVPMKAIRGFSIQRNNGKCNINAVILHTVKGNNICVDPSLGWVSNIIEKLKAQIKVLGNQQRKNQ
ncbi:hypothetical protein ACEWY4_006275 [Coilia grayii]|uniref:Chemokine interleukin-8-like domain-containing protein n=1 Tax=Coilia grayii TaxID=363190 RepID=A0ABD1KDZ8_9TELE